MSLLFGHCIVSRLEGGFYIGTLGVFWGRSRGINGEYFFYTLFIFIMIDHLCVIGKNGNKQASDGSPRQYFCLNRPIIKMVTSFAWGFFLSRQSSFMLQSFLVVGYFLVCRLCLLPKSRLVIPF